MTKIRKREWKRRNPVAKVLHEDKRYELKVETPKKVKPLKHKDTIEKLTKDVLNDDE